MAPSLPAVSCLLLLVGCAAASPFDGEFEGVPTSVELLDEAFVRFEGERRPLEYFLLQMRVRCRAAQGVPEQLPAVRVTVATEAAVSPDFLGRVSTELGKAGVRRVVFGPEGG